MEGIMRAIVSVIGKDSKGIIAGVSQVLYEEDVNIEDISQTLMQEYFTMIMMVSITNLGDIDKLSERLNALGAKLGVEIRVQHEDIFNAMHKI